MTIQELLNTATNKLSRTSKSASLDAEVLLSHVLKKPKEYLAVRTHQYVPLDLKKQFFKLINYRRLGWPVAYLTKKKEFFGLDFYVDKNVLIPRPETEGLVELVLSKVNHQQSLSILDIGTGSGNIIISLAKVFSNSQEFKNRYYASDVSPNALKIARKNARRHRTSILFKQSDLLKAWKKQTFDVIVANLPYLAKRTDHSTKFEPTKALVAKNQGLALYERFFKQIRSYSQIRPFADSIFLEIDHDQGPAIKKLAGKYLPASPAGGPAFDPKISKDLFRQTRYAVLSAGGGSAFGGK